LPPPPPRLSVTHEQTQLSSSPVSGTHLATHPHRRPPDAGPQPLARFTCCRSCSSASHATGCGSFSRRDYNDNEIIAVLRGAESFYHLRRVVVCKIIIKLLYASYTLVATPYNYTYICVLRPSPRQDKRNCTVAAIKSRRTKMKHRFVVIILLKGLNNPRTFLLYLYD